MLEFVVLRASVIALVSLAVLPCFMYFAMIIVLLWANKEINNKLSVNSNVFTNIDHEIKIGTNDVNSPVLR